LCVAIFTNVSLLPASFQFSLGLITIPDTAGTKLWRMSNFTQLLLMHVVCCIFSISRPQ
jgi:hypothetical protein